MKFFDSPTMRETIHRLLRSQMALKGIDYNGLSQRLKALGVSQTATNLRSKINHGTLGAQLFVFIQLALGIDALDLRQIQAIYKDVDQDLKTKEEGSENAHLLGLKNENDALDEAAEILMEKVTSH